MINCVDRVRGLANTLIFLERGETCNVSGDVIHPFIVTGHEVLNTKDYVADVRAAILPRYVAESVEVVSAGRVLRATTISGISLNISFTCQSHYEVGYIFRHFVVDSMIAFSAHFADVHKVLIGEVHGRGRYRGVAHIALVVILPVCISGRSASTTFCLLATD